MIFLPLYRTVAQRLSEGELPEFFNSATVPQLAAVLFIQNAEKLAQQHAPLASMQRQFAQIISAGNQANQQLPQAFQQLVGERFSADQLSAGLSQLAGLKVSLLDVECPGTEERYLDAHGE